MNDSESSPTNDIPAKIRRLVEERGWNQEDFARIAKLNRHTVRQILHAGPDRKLRNATVSQCAEALGLTVHELRTQPLERLLPRMHGKPALDMDVITTLYDRASMQALVSWVERNRDRASQLTPWEVEELIAMQGPEGPLAKLGVEFVIDRLERKRRLMQQIDVIAGSELFPMLEQLVQLMADRVTPR